MRSQSSRLIVPACVLALTSTAMGQLSNLDKATFIEGLRKEGMAELLKHMIEAEPMNDPVLARQALINQLLLQYSTASTRAAGAATSQEHEALTAEAKEYFVHALNESRKAIREHHDHEQRPLWQTNLAEQLLFEDLQGLNQYASEFYEFGVTTADQRQAFEANVIESLEQMTDADLAFFKMTTDLPRRADFTAKFEDTGLWHRLQVEYYKRRSPFFLATAAYLATLIDDSHPYYRNLGKNELIPAQMQKSTPAEERKRLLALVVERMTRMLEDNRDLDISIILRANLLLGRALIAQGNVDQGIKLLQEKVIDVPAAKTDVVSLLAQMAVVRGLDKKNHADAMAMLPTLSSHSAMSDLRFRILHLDLSHRVMFDTAVKAPAEGRRAAIAESYQPYIRFLDESKIPNLELVRYYIYRRWEAAVRPDQDLSQLPHIVLMAVGEIARSDGQNLVLQANGEADADKQAQLMKDAIVKLDRSIKVNDVLLAQSDVEPGVAAWAMYNKALSVYFKDQSNQENLVAAAKTLVDLADKHPEQEIAPRAIAEGMSVLQPMHAHQPSPPGARELYLHGMKVLLEKFPQSEAADAHRLYYGYYVLMLEDHLLEAARVFEPVPVEHPDYWAAQRERCFCLLQLYRRAINASPAPAPKEATASDKPAAPAEQLTPEQLKQMLQEAASNLRLKSSEFADRPEYDEISDRIRSAGGYATLVLTDLAILDNDAKTAADLLRGFIDEHSDDIDLVRMALEKGIWAHAANANFDEALKQANRMMDEFPDDAAYIINSVVIQMDNRIQELRHQAAIELVERRKAEIVNQAVQMADAAYKMTRLLLDWAVGQQLPPEELLPFQMVMVRAWLLKGEPQKTLEFLLPLLEAFPNDADVLINTADCYFQIGNRNDMIAQAAPLYDKIIGGVAPGADGKYPRPYWYAWMRRLQISEKVNEGTDEIPLRVGQLEMFDPTLGGEPFRTELKRLELKYTR